MYQCEFVGYEQDGVQDTHPKDVQLVDGDGRHPTHAGTLHMHRLRSDWIYY